VRILEAAALHVSCLSLDRGTKAQPKEVSAMMLTPFPSFREVILALTRSSLAPCARCKPQRCAMHFVASRRSILLCKQAAIASAIASLLRELPPEFRSNALLAPGRCVPQCLFLFPAVCYFHLLPYLFQLSRRLRKPSFRQMKPKECVLFPFALSLITPSYSAPASRAP
jgi:hypothetical protein